MRPENWLRYDWEPRDIDVALVPFWPFKEETTRKIIREHVAPKKVAVVEIPPGQLEERARELAGEFSDVVFLTEERASAEF